MKWKWMGIVAFLMVAVLLMIPSEPAFSMSQAERNRRDELYALGYSFEVVSDQISEEFYGVDGAFGTGGIDGKLLNGNPPGGNAGGNTTPPDTSTPKPAHKHEYESKTTKEPTCTEEGTVKFTCSCGASYTEKIPALGHDYEVDESQHKDPTCQELGTDTFVCKDCGESFVQPYGELVDHNYVLADDSKEPACTENGSYHWVCSVCNNEYSENVEALDHDWDGEYVIVKSATCTEDGLKEIRCKRCDEIKSGSQVEIKAVGHLENPDHAIAEASAFKDGLETVTCMRCGEVIAETVIPGNIKAFMGKHLLGIGIGCSGLLILIFVVGCVKRKKRQGNK